MKVDRQCAEWGVSTATYQYVQWMSLFKNINHLSQETLEKKVFFNESLKKHLVALLTSKGRIIYLGARQNNISGKQTEKNIF